jgi:putative glycosyltransferase (TIGR04372 family)
VLAIEEIIKRGGWVIRIGSGDSSLLDLIKSEKYIDYPTSRYLSDRMDIFLCAQAKFILGNTSGIALVGSVFGTPCALANMTPISAAGFNVSDISFPKLHWSLSEKRYINVQEIYELKLLDARTAFEYEKAKVKLVENTAEDIRELCIEMFLNLETTNRGNENFLTANHIFNGFPESQIYSNQSPGKFSLKLINKYMNFFIL